MTVVARCSLQRPLVNQAKDPTVPESSPVAESSSSLLNREEVCG